MNPITLANLHNFCRICLREITVESRKAVVNPLRMELVKIVTCITIEQDLLSQICQSCCIRVNALGAFREKAIASTGICKMLVAEFVEDEALPRIKTFCRVCLQRRTGKNEDRYSFKKNSELCLSMFECAGLQIQKCQSKEEPDDVLADDERFPDVICDKCYIGFSNFKEIRSLARLSEDYVNNLLNESKAFKQEDQETNEVAKQHTEQIDVMSNVDIPLKIDVEEFNIKVEPLEFLNNEDVESKTHNTTISDNEYINNEKESEKSEEEINEDFDFETKLSEHSSSTDEEESDKLSSVEFKKAKVKTKQTKIKHKRKQLECEHCGKKFRNRIHFEGHVKGAHEGVENPFSCHCGNKFGDYNTLQRHIKRKHKASEEAMKKTWKGNIFEPPKKSSIHVCLQCNRQFTRKSHLEEHMNSVHLAEDERPFRCQFCQKSFGSSKTLQRHEKNHSSEKPFACEFCPKRYNIKADFNAHMQRHSCSDTSLLCPICKRLKSSAEELKAHVEMHNKSRQHQCTTCGKIFTKLFHLKEHETSVHLKLRPFQCTICEKTFATQRSQKEHEQLHDPNAEKKAICEICKIGFINRKQLSYHRAKEHKTKEQKREEYKRKKTRKRKQSQEVNLAVPYPIDFLS